MIRMIGGLNNDIECVSGEILQQLGKITMKSHIIGFLEDNPAYLLR